MLDIKGLFTKEAIIIRLKDMPDLKTPVMDTLFLDRPQHPLPLLGKDEILDTAAALPLVRRGGASVAAAPVGGTVDFFEPLPVRPSVSVTGAELNNLKLLDGGGLEAWARNKTDYLRKRVRATTEALCGLATSGAITYPVKLEGGSWENFTVSFGSLLSVTPGTLWGAQGAKLKDVMVTLIAMRKAIQAKGFGSELEIWAGEDAYMALFALAEASQTTAKLRVEITDDSIQVGGFAVKLRGETWKNPQTGALAAYVPAKDVRVIAKDGGHKCPYCALDDLDANLQALPFFVKPVKTQDPSGYKLIGESKPFPVVNVNAICGATVLI